jgi:hypothetical protein
MRAPLRAPRAPRAGSTDYTPAPIGLIIGIMANRRFHGRLFNICEWFAREIKRHKEAYCITSVVCHE